MRELSSFQDEVNRPSTLTKNLRCEKGSLILNIPAETQIYDIHMLSVEHANDVSLTYIIYFW